MRNFKANLEPVFYKLYMGEEEILDEYQNSTGLYLPTYSEIKSTMMCVSPNKGSTEVYQFGTLLDYDRTMTTADTNCEIDEDDILWIDGADTDSPYNAIVKKKAQWKNSVQYAIKRVTISEYQQQQEIIRQAKEAKRRVKGV